VKVKIKSLLVYLCILRVMRIILIMHMNIFLTARISLQPVTVKALFDCLFMGLFLFFS